ncbi:tetratricopeptide repeat protein [Flavobacterium sp.]|uniref:tetratricopeptide repeat protein n=1 Tax=Flavobacterium sp. TaxID=239 RepID=UPI0025DA0AA3|nr:tetratricopeptide repeat protein [Flavobacterium sp.]
MKKILSIFLLISQILLAQSAFDQGNQYYQKENYQAAITSFENILNSGKQSAELYFNIGNCYYKLHKVAPAIYNYEKALLLSPNDTEIKTNLEFARKMAIDDIKVIPKVGLNKIILALTSKYHYDTLAWIAVMFAILSLLFFIGFYFSKKVILKRVFFIGMFLWIILICLSTVSGFYEKMRVDNEKPAIIFAETTPLKSEPKTGGQDTALLHEGTKVYILESIANWEKVELTDETVGWIDESASKEIKN